jgi:hypothetical protein
LHRSSHRAVVEERRTAKVDRRESRAFALVDEQLLDGDEVLRVGGRVATEVDQLGGDLGEEGFALRSNGAVKGLCEW